MGLLTLAVSFVGNSALTLAVLPGVVGGRNSPLLRVWLSFNDVLSAYGWMALALGLLIWSFWFRRGYDLRKREWVARIFLIFLLLSEIGVTLLPRLPTRWTSSLLVHLRVHPGWPSALAWGALLLVVGVLCLNGETRDSLLGHGRMLSLISLGSLLLVLTLMTLGWSSAFP